MDTDTMNRLGLEITPALVCGQVLHAINNYRFKDVENNVYLSQYDFSKEKDLRDKDLFCIFGLLDGGGFIVYISKTVIYDPFFTDLVKETVEKEILKIKNKPNE